MVTSVMTLKDTAMTNLDSTLKIRNIALLTKIHIVEAMVFPVVMYGCERWNIKKAGHEKESRRLGKKSHGMAKIIRSLEFSPISYDAFELWCWRRLLRVPWTAKRSNQSILKVINPEYSLEGLMLKLKFQYFGHLM